MKLALTCFILGVLALAILELTAIGVILLLAFIVLGVFALADPEHLD